MAKKYIIVKPDDETEKKNEFLKARIRAMEILLFHYQSFRWFRVNKHLPVDQDTIFGPAIKWDFNTGIKKPQTAEDKAKAQYAERILFQFLRTIEKLNS